MTANSDTIIAAFRSLDPPIVASKIRIVPHSKSPRTICLRAELYGCSQRGKEWKMLTVQSNSDGLLYYSTVPEGSRLGEQDFRDVLFEEIDLMTDTGIKRYVKLLFYCFRLTKAAVLVLSACYHTSFFKLASALVPVKILSVFRLSIKIFVSGACLSFPYSVSISSMHVFFLVP